MNLFENWKNVISKAKLMSQKDIDAWKYLIMVLIVIDMFGIFWYLKMKTLGLALMLVLMGFLAFLLIVGGKDAPLPLPPPKPIHNTIKKEVKQKMDNEGVQKEEVAESQEQPEEKGMFDFDLGLGSSEEFQKRVDKALGTF